MDIDGKYISINFFFNESDSTVLTNLNVEKVEEEENESFKKFIFYSEEPKNFVFALENFSLSRIMFLDIIAKEIGIYNLQRFYFSLLSKELPTNKIVTYLSLYKAVKD